MSCHGFGQSAGGPTYVERSTQSLCETAGPPLVSFSKRAGYYHFAHRVAFSNMVRGAGVLCAEMGWASRNNERRPFSAP
eukprot:scaffold232879_cov17-Prasinocladus_malaysianus.AAC.1